jgi:hypothetical protein
VEIAKQIAKGIKKAKYMSHENMKPVIEVAIFMIPNIKVIVIKTVLFGVLLSIDLMTKYIK